MHRAYIIVWLMTMHIFQLGTKPGTLLSGMTRVLIALQGSLMCSDNYGDIPAGSNVCQGRVIYTSRHSSKCLQPYIARVIRIAVRSKQACMLTTTCVQ